MLYQIIMSTIAFAHAIHIDKYIINDITLYVPNYAISK